MAGYAGYSMSNNAVDAYIVEKNHYPNGQRLRF
jgi:hypothetical protein